MAFETLKRVFGRPAYLALAVLTSVLTFVFATWIPNIRLIVSVLGSSDASLYEKLALPFSLIGSITTNFTALSATYTIAISLLFGVYIAMVAYHLKRRVVDVRQSGVAAGFLGVVSGFLGIGCAACGSFLFTGIATLAGATGVLAFLPFAGGEFGILGVVLLGYATYLLAQHMTKSPVCEPNDLKRR